MTKIMSMLQEQHEIPEYRKETEDCIKIYNWIKEIDSKSYRSKFSIFIETKLIGEFPKIKILYIPNKIGQTLLKGIELDNKIKTDNKLSEGDVVTINLPFNYTIGDIGFNTDKKLETIEDCVNEVKAEIDNGVISEEFYYEVEIN